MAASFNTEESFALLSQIHAAILNDDVEQLDACCGGNVNLDSQFTPEINPQHVGMTPVSLAAALNKPELARVLLEHGADANAVFATLSTTALMTAAFHGHTEVVRLLLDYGADVRMVDLQQSTALGYAFGGTRNLEVIELLLRAGADVNKKNMLGMNAILLVAGYGNDQLVEMVLKAGADPNSTNEFGHTALHLAVVGKKDQLQKLKQQGNAEAATMDRALNRRNLDEAMVDWARQHKDAVVGNPQNDPALQSTGKFMMDIGQKLELGDNPQYPEELDDQEAMKRSIDACYKYRQDRIQHSKDEKKSGGLGLLLSCGGGKSKKAADKGGNKSPMAAKPYMDDSNAPSHASRDPQIIELNERCTRILRMLIESACEIDKTERTFGMTALDMAILNGDVESSALLVSYGGDADHLMKMFASTDLYQAIIMQDKKSLKDLLTFDKDMDVNMPFSSFNITRGGGGSGGEDTSDAGLTPITIAARTQDDAIIKMLLKAGANVNDAGYIGRAPIHETAAKGYLKTIQLLIANKADHEQPCLFFKNATPVAVAVMFGQHETVRYFIKRGCKVDKPMADGRVSLFKAMEAQDMPMVDILLDADIASNYIDQQGFMAAMAQKYQAKDKNVEAILSEAADVVRSFNEREAQQIAQEEEMQRQEEMAKMDANANRQHQQHPPPQQQQQPQQQQPTSAAQVNNAAPQQPGYVMAQPAGGYAEPAEPGYPVAAEPAQRGYVIAQPAAVSSAPIAAQPSYVAASPAAPVQPGYVMAEPAQPGFVVAQAAQPGFVIAEAAQPGVVFAQAGAQQEEEEAPTNGPAKQTGSVSSSDADEDSITDSDEDDGPPPLPAGPPPPDDDDDIEDSEEEEDESEEEEESDEDEPKVISKTTTVTKTTVVRSTGPVPAPKPANLVNLNDDLDDISDSDEEEDESEEEEDSDEEFKEAKENMANGKASTETEI